MLKNKNQLIIDADALWVLMISIAVILLTLGLFFIILSIYVIYIANISQSKVNPKETTFLVFGKKLVNNHVDKEYRMRLNRLVDCKFQSAVILGGYTGISEVSEAQAGYNYIDARHLKISPIRLEQQSTNTLENLKNARQFLLTKNIAIISSRYHLARCRLMASSLGIPHQLCAAENGFYWNPENIAKCLLEAFYLHWFFSGRYWAILTQNQRMLKKIS